MQSLNKPISLLLSILMVLSLVMPVQAIEPNANEEPIIDEAVNEQVAGGGNNTPVTLTQAVTLFNVTVPTKLPINVDENSVVTTATDAYIKNDSFGPVVVSNVTVNPINDWSLVDYNTDFKLKKANLKEFGMQLNTENVDTNGSILLSNSNWSAIAGNGGKLNIAYNANVATQTIALEQEIATAVFVIAWNTNRNVDDSGDVEDEVDANTVDYSLTEDDVQILSFEVPKGTDVMFESSDTNVAIIEPYNEIEATSFNDFNGYSYKALADTETKKAKLTTVSTGVTSISAKTTSGQILATLTIGVVDKKIIGAKIVRLPDTLDYCVGSRFKSAGMKIEATYDDGSKITVTSGFKVLNSKLNTTGIQIVNIQYGKFTLQVEVTVSELQFVKIEVLNKPIKTEYLAGENLDATGLVLKATYNNGKTVIVRDGYEVDESTNLTVGAKTVPVTYAGLSTSFDIIVYEAEIESIAVYTPATKNTYYTGDDYDPTGLVLEIRYVNGSIAHVEDGYDLENDTCLIDATSTITIYYGDYECTTTVTVIEEAIANIAVKTMPTKTTYYEGENVVATGMVLTVTYNSGRTLTVDKNYTLSNNKNLKVGDNIVTVSYAGKTTTFTVVAQAAAMVGIEVFTPAVKTDYNIGEDYDATGLVLKAVYNNGKTEQITTGYTLENDKSLTAGNQIITIKYNGFATTTSVTVNSISITGLTVKTNPTKTSYNIGDNFNTTGLVLEATYSDGSKKDITTGYTVVNGNNLQAGTKSVNISYGGMITNVNVSVEDRSWDTNPMTTANMQAMGLSYYNIDGDSVGLGVTADATSSQVGYTGTATTLSLPTSINGKKVTTIGKYAFYNCGKLTSVVIPDTINSIESYAFGNCRGLFSFTIPSTVTTINSYAFNSVPNVIYEGTATGSPWGALCNDGYIDNGLLYSNSNKTVLKACNINKTGSVTIPSSVTSIGYNAFYGCSKLTSVTIPDGITSIGTNAFNGCYSITSLDIPMSVTTIGSYAFSGIQLIRHYGLCTSTGSPTWGATSYKILETASPIGNVSTGNYKYMVSMETCNNMGLSVVQTYDKKGYAIKATKRGEASDWGASASVSGDLIIPSHVDGIPVTEIYGETNGCFPVGGYSAKSESGAFYFCNNLTSVTIPNTVETISYAAFKYCGGVTMFTIPDSVKYINAEAFAACYGLTSLVIPNSVISLGSLAFQGCRRLSSIIISNKMTSLPYDVFGNCYSLRNVYIPANIKSIDASAFKGCGDYLNNSGGMNNIVVDANNPNYCSVDGVIFSKDMKTLVYCSAGKTGSYTIPSSVTKIGDNAFSTTFLTSVSIPNSVQTIGACCFENPLTMKSISIPSSVTSIGTSAFTGISTVVYSGSASGSPWGASNRSY